MATASESQIGLFLDDLHKALTNEIYIEKTDKNTRTRVTLGYTRKNIKDVINKLSIEDYSEGPLPSKQTSSKLWVFGTDINNQQIYIKIEIGRYSYTGEEKRTAFIVSFHFAEKDMRFPYKK